MNKTDIIAQATPILDKMQDLQIEWRTIPKEEDLSSAHETLHFSSVQKKFEKQLGKFCKIVNTFIPKHWEAFILIPAYSEPHQKFELCVSTIHHDTHEPFEASKFARYLGILFETVLHATKPIDRKAAKRWYSLGFPETFDSPQQIFVHGNLSGRTLYGNSVNDCIAQSIVYSEYWNITRLLKSAKNKSYTNNFEKGQTWLQKEFFKYCNQTWDTFPIFYDKIIKTKTLTKNEIQDLDFQIDSVSNGEIDFILKTMLENLLTVNKTDEDKLYTITNMRNNHRYAHEKISIHTAKSKNHAIAKHIRQTMQCFSGKDDFVKYGPQKWDTYLSTPI